MIGLFRYSRPKNVREFRNMVERAVVDVLGNEVTFSDLRLERMETYRPPIETQVFFQDQVSHARRQVIRRALERSRGDVTTAAREPNLTRHGLQKLIQGTGIDFQGSMTSRGALVGTLRRRSNSLMKGGTKM